MASATEVAEDQDDGDYEQPAAKLVKIKTEPQASSSPMAQAFRRGGTVRDSANAFPGTPGKSSPNTNTRSQAGKKKRGGGK